jgi:arylsulfatase A-like enzyme
MRYRKTFEQQPVLTEEEKTMFAYISEMDNVVGSVMEAVHHNGLYNNSVIIFSSDNGAPGAWNVRDRNWPLRGFKSQIWEGGTKVPGFIHSPLLPAKARGTQSHALLHVTDWLPTIARLARVRLDTSGAPLDGFDAWPAVSSGGPGERHELLYNVNPLCGGGQAGPPKVLTSPAS